MIKKIVKTLADVYVQGSTEIWYARNEFLAKSLFGMRQTVMPEVATLQSTHSLLGTVDEIDLSVIFRMMQKQQWNPKGEMGPYLDSLQLTHSSMCAGDVIKVGPKFYLCMLSGFIPLHDSGADDAPPADPPGPGTVRHRSRYLTK